MNAIKYRKKYIAGALIAIAVLVIYTSLSLFDSNSSDIYFCALTIVGFIAGAVWGAKYLGKYSRLHPKSKFYGRFPLPEKGQPELNICVFNCYKWLLVMFVGFWINIIIG